MRRRKRGRTVRGEQERTFVFFDVLINSAIKVSHALFGYLFIYVSYYCLFIYLFIFIFQFLLFNFVVLLWKSSISCVHRGE